jgi:alpha-1,2-mannosyltransferase
MPLVSRCITLLRTAWTLLFATLSVPLAFAVAGIARLIGLIPLGPRAYPTPRAAFFHPDALLEKGGGERVLFSILAALNASDTPPPLLFGVPPSADELSSAQVTEHALSVFGIDVPDVIFQPIHLPFRPTGACARLVEFIGTALPAAAALFSCRLLGVSVILDTSGCPILYPLAVVAGVQPRAYVHFPYVRPDEIQAARSLVRRAYLSCLLAAYRGCLRRLGPSAVNSSYTESHIAATVGASAIGPPLADALADADAPGFESASPSPTLCMFHKLLPPLGTAELTVLPLDTSRRFRRPRIVLALGAFRSDKRQGLLLKAFGLYIRKHPAARSTTRMIFAGSARGPNAIGIIARLHTLAFEVDVHDCVDFAEGLPRAALLSLLGEAAVGMHGMRDEHFGIAPVEYMAGGAVCIAHRSGGPLRDIIGPSPGSGLLADTAEEYAAALELVLETMDSSDREAMQVAARVRARQLDCWETAVYGLLAGVPGGSGMLC